jgi:hypothetical protein
MVSRSGSGGEPSGAVVVADGGAGSGVVAAVVAGSGPPPAGGGRRSGGSGGSSWRNRKIPKAISTIAQITPGSEKALARRATASRMRATPR